MLEKLRDFCTSTRCALILFGLLSFLSLLGTFPGMEGIYRMPLFRGAVGLLGCCTLACTIRSWRRLKWPVLIIHAGVIVTLAGGMASWLGYVATVNVYEGDTVRRFFRWDMEQDQSLGFDLTIRRITTDYFPVPVRVGVMQGDRKKELFTLRTGESFALDRYRVTAERLDAAVENLHLTVTDNGTAIGRADTEGNADLPADFPYRFKLVAFQNPVLKRMWVDVAIQENGQAPVTGVSEVNAPFQWNGLSIFCTQVARDPEGRRYAGIQVVKDPGRLLAFAGMFLTALGGLCALAVRKVWS